MESATKADLKNLLAEFRSEIKQSIRQSVAEAFGTWKPAFEAQASGLQVAVDLLEQHACRDKCDGAEEASLADPLDPSMLQASTTPIPTTEEPLAVDPVLPITTISVPPSTCSTEWPSCDTTGHTLAASPTSPTATVDFTSVPAAAAGHGTLDCKSVNGAASMAEWSLVTGVVTNDTTAVVRMLCSAEVVTMPSPVPATVTPTLLWTSPLERVINFRCYGQLLRPIPWPSFRAVQLTAAGNRPRPWPSFRVTNAGECPSDVIIQQSRQCSSDSSRAQCCAAIGVPILNLYVMVRSLELKLSSNGSTSITLSKVSSDSGNWAALSFDCYRVNELVAVQLPIMERHLLDFPCRSVVPAHLLDHYLFSSQLHELVDLNIEQRSLSSDGQFSCHTPWPPPFRFLNWLQCELYQEENVTNVWRSVDQEKRFNSLGVSLNVSDNFLKKPYAESEEATLSGLISRGAAVCQLWHILLFSFIALGLISGERSNGALNYGIQDASYWPEHFVTGSQMNLVLTAASRGSRWHVSLCHGPTVSSLVAVLWDERTLQPWDFGQHADLSYDQFSCASRCTSSLHGHFITSGQMQDSAACSNWQLFLSAPLTSLLLMKFLGQAQEPSGTLLYVSKVAEVKLIGRFHEIENWWNYVKELHDAYVSRNLQLAYSAISQAGPNLLLTRTYQFTCDPSEDFCSCVQIIVNLHNTTSWAGIGGLDWGTHQAGFSLHMNVTCSVQPDSEQCDSALDCLFNAIKQFSSCPLLHMQQLRSFSISEGSGELSPWLANNLWGAYQIWLVAWTVDVFLNRIPADSYNYLNQALYVDTVITDFIYYRADSRDDPNKSKELHVPWDPGKLVLRYHRKLRLGDKPSFKEGGVLAPSPAYLLLGCYAGTDGPSPGPGAATYTPQEAIEDASKLDQANGNGTAVSSPTWLSSSIPFPAFAF